MMVNLLRFAAEAAYPEGFDAEPCSGAEAYRRYGEAAQPFLEKVGGLTPRHDQLKVECRLLERESVEP